MNNDELKALLEVNVSKITHELVPKFDVTTPTMLDHPRLKSKPFLHCIIRRSKEKWILFDNFKHLIQWLDKYKVLRHA